MKEDEIRKKPCLKHAYISAVHIMVSLAWRTTLHGLEITAAPPR
jgi:hypothetical protein